MSALVKYILLVFFTCITVIGFSQLADSSRQSFLGFDLDKQRKLTVLPTVYFKPETNWAFGVSALMYRRFNQKDTISPLSLAGLSFAYTLNDQVLFSMPFKIFLKQDNYRIKGEISYYRYPYFFAGIGNSNTTKYEEDYDASFPRFDITGLKKFKKRIYTGPKLFYQNTTISSVEPNGLLDASGIAGATGSVTTGIGWELEYDARDFIYAPTKGYYANLSFLGFNEVMGGNFGYNLFTLDIRKYVNLGKNHIIGIQGYGFSIFGIAPFNKLSQLGGDKIMRGYLKGEFRDNHLLASQLEYRTPIWYFFGFTAFAGTGAVADRLEEFNTDFLRYSYGGGVRLAFNKKERVHIRFDYARGDNNRQQFYLTFAESF